MTDPGASSLIVGPARLGDAAGIAAVHVAAWRSAYANLLPGDYLAGLSVVRHAALHHQAIADGRGVLVARAGGPAAEGRAGVGADERIVGFCTTGRPRTPGLADGEVETLYVLDDWRDQGLGRRLLSAGAAHLASEGCRSLFLWVLQQNPSRWFYERLGGRAAATSMTQVAGKAFPQVAYVWNPIGQLTAVTKAG